MSQSRESIYELQKIDCNCNDCAFMQRDMDKYNDSLEVHKRWQLMEFEGARQRVRDKAEWWRKNKGELGKWDDLHQEADKMVFQFDRNMARINYGYCSKLSKSVTFLPRTCQVHTQICFIHRKDFKQ